MDTPTSLVPASSWRAEGSLTEVDGGSIYFQPNRFDVVVHLLALEQLAGTDQGKKAFSVDWLQRSDLFALEDNEPSVGQLAAELMTSPTTNLEVAFASGGQLVRGASAAAGALYRGVPATRVDGTTKAIDRSIRGLSAEGWSTADLRSLIRAWAVRDGAATVVLVDLDAPFADEAVHELTCRYSAMHSEIDHVSMIDAANLTLTISRSTTSTDRRPVTQAGSVQLLCLRESASELAAVLERHGDAVAFTARREHAVAALDVLWGDARVASTSRDHDLRLRRLRRKQLTDQFLERALGR